MGTEIYTVLGDPVCGSVLISYAPPPLAPPLCFAQLHWSLQFFTHPRHLPALGTWSWFPCDGVFLPLMSTSYFPHHLYKVASKPPASSLQQELAL